jgi:cytochrome d ubiquinol oxidase subunit II
LVPSLVFGVAIGNVLQGVPFGFDEFMVINNQIGFFSLFSPFALLCGLVSVTMLITHGATFLAIKTEGVILKRTQKFLIILPPITIILFAIGGLFLNAIDGYKLVSFAGTLADSNPLAKEVTRVAGGWFDNYSKYQWILLAPTLGFLGQILVLLFVYLKHFGKAFIASAISILGIISTAGLTLFPFILPSSLDPNSSLMVWDSSSSYRALFVMLIATIIFMPLILFYTSWVFKVLKGKVTENDIKKDSKFLY